MLIELMVAFAGVTETWNPELVLDMYGMRDELLCLLMLWLGFALMNV